MKRPLMILVCITLCLAVERVAHAQQLVTNGVFQGSVTNWDGSVSPIPSWDGWNVIPTNNGSNYGIAGAPKSPSLFQAYFGWRARLRCHLADDCNDGESTLHVQLLAGTALRRQQPGRSGQLRGVVERAPRC